MAKEQARANGEDPMHLREEAYIPACAEVCPTGAIYFGDLYNPEHRVHALARSPYAFRLLENLGAEPQVYYLSRRAWVRELGDNEMQKETQRGS